ncbi:hypothetical protein BST81_08890 [Leptolyngbya sp. 'hensonii']|uniref:hypothetical protein n=1 Tax=Leptolyngbya sp. 'hensonii' TaxID=1922337 RepID=UPI00094FE24C|nr:hypothetical protein [Leptolyngbya sp. 'hensonii']OLP18750.1 hypothetical protein BST81_08890 [Leptolyngbya sp. 'hensonii']
MRFSSGDATRSLPTLINQLVVLVSKTQWRGEVPEEMALPGADYGYTVAQNGRGAGGEGSFGA